MSDDLHQAAQAAEAALAAGSADAHDYMVISLAHAHGGAMADADELIGTARTLEPHNPAIWIGLAIIRRQQGRLRDAVIACDEAIRLAPAYSDAWRERAAVLAAGGSIAEARRSFVEAARLDPGVAAAHAGLAALAAREGAAEEAEGHARRALALDPGNVVAVSSLGNAMLATGRAAGVPGLLEPHIAKLGEPSPDRVLALSVLADSWRELGEHVNAFASYQASKTDFAAIHARDRAGQMTHREFVEAIHDGLAELDTTGWPATTGGQPGSAIERHVFLIGYPRSGTTLAENVLASLEGVTALEERPTLATADGIYLAGNRAQIRAALRSFATIEEPALCSLREAYWGNVHRSGLHTSSTAFVDMDPLKGTRLPLIARLFPAAKIMIMRRDPRDVVWSCFRTNFAMTSGTLEYTTLEGAARHYDAMMRLTELALKKLPLSTHVVPYHELVHSFEATTREICQFAGLEWSEAVYRFDATAQRRGVSTASAPQVRRGLYDGTQQWEPYARWLEPVMPILKPWVEKFGYGR